MNDKVYTFRFITPSSNVYVINKVSRHIPKPQPFKNCIYSEVYTKKHESLNAVIAFSNELLCQMKLDLLQKSDHLVAQDDIFIMNKVILSDLKEHCDRLNMPLNVMMNTYCDVHDKLEYTEVFYYNKKRLA